MSDTAAVKTSKVPMERYAVVALLALGLGGYFGVQYKNAEVLQMQKTAQTFVQSGTTAAATGTAAANGNTVVTVPATTTVAPPK